MKTVKTSLIVTATAAALVASPAAAAVSSLAKATTIGGTVFCGAAGAGVFAGMKDKKDMKDWMKYAASAGTAGGCGLGLYLLYRSQTRKATGGDKGSHVPGGLTAGVSGPNSTVLPSQIAADGWTLVKPPVSATPTSEANAVDQTYATKINDAATWASSYRVLTGASAASQADDGRMVAIARDIRLLMPESHKIADHYNMMKIAVLHQHLVTQVTAAVDPSVSFVAEGHRLALRRHLEWLNGSVKALADRAPK